MKTISLNIIVFIVLALFSTSCEKTPPNPSGDSKNLIKVELNYDKQFNYKTGEDDDRPFVDTISGKVTSYPQNPVSADVELLDSLNNNLLDSTTTDSNGYFFFYDVVTGSYIVLVYIDGEVIETIYVSI